jgi:hypothetical protein
MSGNKWFGNHGRSPGVSLNDSFRLNFVTRGKRGYYDERRSEKEQRSHPDEQDKRLSPINFLQKKQ